ncbi:MAG: hypothetical protein A3J24_01045 [Deltaproteobacteria bacterium RIFCSPLOWO2_02_FULL_53_8]|nr:MAG: hypothetical protein A3J24_01045 [Deltaproteobacteria bacterium RIFCSPLOWO2_02_FULL_53_8]
MAYRDQASASGASASFFESLASSLGVAAGYIGLYQKEMHAKRFFERIISQLPYGVAVFERDGSCKLCNDNFRAIMGCGHACEYKLFADTSLVSSGVLDSLKRSFDGYSAQAVVNYDPSAFFLKFGFSGRPAQLKLSSYPLYDMDGEISNIVIIYENLSQDEEASSSAD